MPKPAAPLLVKGFQCEGLLLDMGYHIPLSEDGNMRNLLAYCVDEIVTDINCSLDREAAATFPQVNGRR